MNYNIFVLKETKEISKNLNIYLFIKIIQNSMIRFEKKRQINTNNNRYKLEKKEDAISSFEIFYYSIVFVVVVQSSSSSLTLSHLCCNRVIMIDDCNN